MHEIGICLRPPPPAHHIPFSPSVSLPLPSIPYLSPYLFPLSLSSALLRLPPTSFSVASPVRLLWGGIPPAHHISPHIALSYPASYLISSRQKLYLPASPPPAASPGMLTTALRERAETSAARRPASISPPRPAVFRPRHEQNGVCLRLYAIISIYMQIFAISGGWQMGAG